MRRNKHCSKALIGTIVVALIAETIGSPLTWAGNDPRAINVRFEVTEKKVIISYDLIGDPEEEYVVNVILKRESDSTRTYRPRLLKGDTGEGILAGRNRQITWDLYSELPKGLVGNDYYFLVTVDKMSSGFSWWAGAGAVAAGIFFLIALAGSGDDNPKNSSLPFPPGRP